MERLLTSEGAARARTGPPILKEQWADMFSFSSSCRPGRASFILAMAFSRFSMGYSSQKS